MKGANITLWILALPLLWCASAFAATVYKTVDEQGRVTFSDTPPTTNITVETVVIDAPQPLSSGLAEKRLEEMRVTTDRMVADRMARERHRAELRSLEQDRLRQSEQWAAERNSSVTVTNGSVPFFVPVRRPGHFPGRPSGRPPVRPDHPLVRPPLRPPTRPMPPAARPLPADYPASLIRRSYDPKVQAAFQ
jgi:hypothetical protein